MIDQGGRLDWATPGPFVEGRSEGNVAGKPFWLDLEPEPIYGVLHTPREGLNTRVAALILPPFGCDEEFSYRPRRDWAIRLAESGVAAVRIDFPGTEDSIGSPLAPNRFQSWVDAAAQTAHWLRELTGCDRLVTVGIGLGGVVAYQAIAADAPIDDLVLWGVRATGRAQLRELRAFAAVVAGDTADAPSETRADGALCLGGHMMSAETAATLSAIKLAEAPLPQAELRRVLLVGRDAGGVDEKLRQSLAESGAALTVLDVDDYRRLVAEPGWQWTPTKTISASIEWLLRDSPYPPPNPIRHLPPLEVPVVLDSVEFEYAGVRIREQLSEVQTATGRLTGVISEPIQGQRAPHCLVAVSAGALRRTSPSRMFVEIARRAAASGVPAARFDLPGTGDADGTWVTAFERTVADDADSLAALTEIYDHLQQLGTADRFVGTGLCLGGYFSIRVILEDERSIGAISANPPAFKWTDAQRRLGVRWFAALGGEAVTEDKVSGGPTGVLRSFSRRVARARRAVEWRLAQRLTIVNLLWRFEHRAGISAAAKTLDQLGASGAKVFLLFSEEETGLRMLGRSRLAAKLERWPNIEVERLPTRDHNLRPLATQQRMLDRVSSVLLELDLTAEGRTMPSSPVARSD
jgi:alpha-beta hydrolase superfamily lysophospholipase